jgi:hypothetical protein
MNPDVYIFFSEIFHVLVVGALWNAVIEVRMLCDRPSGRHLSSKLVQTFADRRCRVVSSMDPYCRILLFLDRSRYFFFQVEPQLFLRGLVGPVPDPLLLRKSSSAGNRTRSSGSVARNSDH